MSRIYNEMWEETGEAIRNDYATNETKKYFGKITVKVSENKINRKSFYTLTTKEELFENREQKNKLCSELTAVLKILFEKYLVKEHSKILVVGLGNEKITADSLGCRVSDKLTVTSHMYGNLGVRNRYGNLCTFKCGVSGTTGIESFDIVQSAVKATKPDLIVAVDTLSCQKSERLGCSLQLTDNGIEPGGGINNPKRKLTEDSLNVPVIAIGVPFVIYVRTILAEHGITDDNEATSSLLVTAKDIDFLIEDFSEVIAKAINNTVHHYDPYVTV